jgi:hypothetical protein
LQEEIGELKLEIKELKGEIKELREQIRKYEQKRDAEEALSERCMHFDGLRREKEQEKREKEQEKREKEQEKREKEREKREKEQEKREKEQEKREKEQRKEEKELRLYQKQDKRLEALQHSASDDRALSQQLSAVNLQADDSPPVTMTAGYAANVGNGIEEDKYVKRTVADAIVKRILAKPNRLLLRGAPASGKTSIMGDVFRQLCQLYEGKSTRVFYLNATTIPYDQDRREVVRWIGRHRDIVVLVDDAQQLYELESFFNLFKSGDRSLIAAASYSPATMNPDTPLDLEPFESCVVDEELPRVFAELGLKDDSDENMKKKQLLEMWFGRSFGRIVLIGERLLTLWKELCNDRPNESLEHFYYQATTLQKLFRDRFVPKITDKLRDQIKAFYLGKLDKNAEMKLASYGILQDNGQWTCDYIERFYFSKVFHAETLQKNLFAGGHVPSCSELLYIGLSGIDWTGVRQCRESSKNGQIPIEDTWQTHFYMSVGKYIPQNMVFCKERASTGGKLDFMLRNGRKLGIELLIESRAVAEHHNRFEGNGQYVELKLNEFLVCDIVVGEESLEEVPDGVTKSFSKAGERKSVHSVFWVNSALTSGTLYLYADEQIQKADVIHG